MAGSQVVLDALLLHFDAIRQFLLVVSKKHKLFYLVWVSLSLTLTLSILNSSAVWQFTHLCIDRKNEPAWFHLNIQDGHRKSLMVMRMMLLLLESFWFGSPHYRELYSVCSSVSVVYCREKAAMKKDEAQTCNETDLFRGCFSVAWFMIKNGL